MARFRNQVSKGIEEKPETSIQKPEVGKQKWENGEAEPKTKNQKPETSEEESQVSQLVSEASVIYSEADMEPVNVAGFKVPYIVREHWKKGCREKRVKLSPMLKRILVDEFGLPPGLTLDDL